MVTESNKNLRIVDGTQSILPILLPIPKARMEANFGEQLCHASESGCPLYVVLTDDGTAPFGAQRLSGESGARLHLEPNGDRRSCLGSEMPAGACAAWLARDKGHRGGHASREPELLEPLRDRPATHPVAGRGTVADDRGEPQPFRHTHDRAALRSSRPVARTPVPSGVWLELRWRSLRVLKPKRSRR